MPTLSDEFPLKGLAYLCAARPDTNSQELIYLCFNTRPEGREEE
ncbi:MAG: hypothetical protein AB8B41_03995 [Prochlorococcus sp.]